MELQKAVDTEQESRQAEREHREPPAEGLPSSHCSARDCHGQFALLVLHITNATRRRGRYK